MPTTIYLRDMTNEFGAGNFASSQRRGRNVASYDRTITAGGTNFGYIPGTGQWWVEPFTQTTTISGPITMVLAVRESAATVNVAVNVTMQKRDTLDAYSTMFLNFQLGAELDTTESTRTGTTTPSSRTFAPGDRIRIRIAYNNVGTAGAGTATLFTNGAGPGLSGDSYMTFTETFVTSDIQDVSPFEIKGTNAYYG